MHELLLESGDKDIRTAAGENTAVIFEILRAASDHEVRLGPYVIIIHASDGCIRMKRKKAMKSLSTTIWMSWCVL